MKPIRPLLHSSSRLPVPRPIAVAMKTAIAALFVAGAGYASAADEAAVAAKPAATETVTEELIRLLSDRNALSKTDAERLIRRLQTEKPAQPTVETAAPASTATPPGAAAPATATAAGDTKPTDPKDPKNRVRVIYLPDSEKQRIREELKDEVLATARAENWAQPSALPEWIKNIKLDGDLRLREDVILLDKDNDPFQINYQAINSGNPFNVSSSAVNQPLPPLLNTTEDRQATRFRLRLGLLANVSDDISATVRLTTGNTVNPLSPNQTVGNANNKFQLLIDRAFLNYHPLAGLNLYGGRIPNPWFGTNLVWDENLGFDGLATRYSHGVGDNVTAYSTFGAFVIENTAFDFPSTSALKAGSRDASLFGFQMGADWKVDDGLTAKGAVAFYDYENLDGELSSPCVAPTNAFSCDTDESRPTFLQKGNTLFALRNLQLQTSTDPQFQYFGLASKFRILDVNGELDYRIGGPLHAIFNADVAWNTAYDAGKVLAREPVNNFGPEVSVPKFDSNGNPVLDSTGKQVVEKQQFYKGGDLAYLLRFKIGYPDIAERNQWNLTVGYRRLETDSVVDALTDADFHLGGTNSKGYYIFANYGFSHRAWFTLKWLSATEATGVRYSADLLQLDINARF